MGKNLKKDCGKGICQRKNGLYHARFVDKTGKRYEKYFQTLPDAQNRMEKAKYADKHDDVFVATNTTVDQWFAFWIEDIVWEIWLLIRSAIIGSDMFMLRTNHRSMPYTNLKKQHQPIKKNGCKKGVVKI